MNNTPTIQDVNVATLREIDPQRVYVEAIETFCVRRCGTDYLHGKGVVSIWPDGRPMLDYLCLACAIPVVEGWLDSDTCDYVTVVVLR
jgi:hypothetical protein